MSNIEKQVLDLGTMPTKGIDYWTPEEAEEMNNAKNGALVAAQEARTAKQETDAATGRANEAATNANGAAGVAMEEAGRAVHSANNADDATVNANRAAADANRAYNTVTNYHDTVTVPDHNRAEQDHTRAEQDHTRHVEDHQEAVRQRAAEATEFNRTQQEKQTEFERTEKARQDEFDSKEEHRDWANAEAVTFADNMADVNRDMGKYQQLPDVALTLVESGKRIDKDGSFVADSSFNIGRLGAVSKGNIYELLMGGSDKMVLGTALFVSHTIERIGGQDKDVYKPIYSAVTADLPISTYAVLLAGEDYSDVLVSYRNDVSGANVLKVARWGIFASIATQLANLRGDVDLKSFSDGYYDNMGVGFAKNLIGDGEATAEEFTERVAGGTHQIDDSLAEYVTIKGNSVVKNQHLNNYNITTDGVTFSYVDGILSITGEMVLDKSYRIGTLTTLPKGHLALVISPYLRFIDGYTGVAGPIFTVSDTISMFLRRVTDNQVDKEPFGIIDLTQWYNGNVPEGLTAEQFIAMNPDVLTMPYTEPHVVNMTAEGVKTTGRNMWDEEWEHGYLSNGWIKLSNRESNTFGPKHPIPVKPNTQYSLTIPRGSVVVEFFDDNNAYILESRVQSITNARVFTSPSNAAYMRFNTSWGGHYNNDICINVSDPSFNGQYEPHVTSERKWTDTMKKCFPEGMVKAGTAYDEMTSTKAVKRFGVVDLGSLNWVYEDLTAWGITKKVFACVYNAIPDLKDSTTRNAVCAKYEAEGGWTVWNNNLDKKIACNTRLIWGKDIVVADSSYTSLSDFKAAMQGVLLYYELAEPIVTTYDELNLTSRVWRNGMEEIIVPEGNESSPISADVIYQINAFKTIKANKQGIEELNAKPAISLTADEVAKLRALINTNTQNLED